MSENFFDKAERETSERVQASNQRKHDLFMKMLEMLEEVERISSATNRASTNLNAINFKVRRLISEIRRDPR